jgi:hypothetical protein
VVDGRVDAPQHPPDLVVGADAGGGGEVARAHAVDLVLELAQPRGEARAGHEVQELEREEERHHQHHEHVEHHLEQHVLHELAVDHDVKHAHRLVGGDGQRDDVVLADLLVAPAGRGIQAHRDHRGAPEVVARPDRLVAAAEEHAALGVGERREAELGVLVDHLAERLLDAVERGERHPVAGRLEDQRAHRRGHGGRLLLGLGDELALEHAMGEVRDHGERQHDAQHDHPGEPPIDAPEVVLLQHHSFSRRHLALP